LSSALNFFDVAFLSSLDAALSKNFNSLSDNAQKVAPLAFESMRFLRVRFDLKLLYATSKSAESVHGTAQKFDNRRAFHHAFFIS
jgi:hypothetical protein